MKEQSSEDVIETASVLKINELKQQLRKKKIFNQLTGTLPERSSSQNELIEGDDLPPFAAVNIKIPRKLIDITKINEVIIPGLVFEVIILEKDNSKRTMNVQLSRLIAICDRCNLNQLRESDVITLRSKKAQLQELKRAFQYKIISRIHENDLLEHFSIFSEEYNFDNLHEGDELVAVVVKTNQLEYLDSLNSEHQVNFRIEMSTKNDILQDSKFLSIQNIIDPSSFDPNNDLFIRLGRRQDNSIRASQTDLQYLEKHNILPYDLQIKRSTSLRNISNRENMILYMKLDENDTLNSYFTNKNLFQSIQIDYKRIRELQNINWAKQALKKASELIKENHHQQALSYLQSAQDFDPYMPQIYLTRGCALANLGKLKEGIIELKKSLSLDPENEVALKYLEKVQLRYDDEQKLMYTKNAKQLNFDKQKLEMKNTAALQFNSQDNQYKFVSESQIEFSQTSTNNQSSDLNSKRTYDQYSKRLEGTANNQKGSRSSSSSSPERKKKKKKEHKKDKKSKKEKKDKKKRSISSSR